jgi:lipopolysaccharide transport system ATP-binding protein
MEIVFAGETHHLPAGIVVGCVGSNDSGARDLLRQAGGRYVGPLDPLDFTPADAVIIDYALDLQDEFRRLRLELELEKLRRLKVPVLLGSHDQALLRRVADEIWWVFARKVRKKGDPAEVLEHYNRAVMERLRATSGAAVVLPALRRGDGRAQLTGIETHNSQGIPTPVWRSGEPVSVRVHVQFSDTVENPVVGIMIRSRIGVEVYGTNTELESIKLGPCRPGDSRTVTFDFPCNLCPQHYTLTVASHDPDGVWHDWLEDAVAVTVVDTRYTAGVANLRASVTCSPE